MEPQQQPPEQPTGRLMAWSVVCLAVFTVAVYVGHRYCIAPWDWLQLLVVPAVLAGGGIWFNRQQRGPELEIAEQSAQDEALQAYLDGMAQSLADKERSLLRARPGDGLRRGH